MNVMYLCDEYPPGRHGGIGTVVRLLAREMAARGHRVVVAGYYDLGYQGQDRLEDDGVTVYRFRSPLDGTWWGMRESLPVRMAHRLATKTGVRHWDVNRTLPRYHAFLESLIREHRIQVVERPDYNDFVQYCKRPTALPPLSVPTVVKLHGTMTYFLKEANRPVPPVVFEVERRMLFQADALISVSEYTARQTARYFGYEKPIPVIYNGVDTQHHTNGIPKDPNLVVFSGSLQEKKGIFQLMKAWNRVHAIMPEARLRVFGRGQVERARALLDGRALESVAFMGHVPHEELFLWLSSASVAVFPSYAECFAMGPMEAMACGTAVIYSTLTSGPELITHGVDGLLCDPDDVGKLAVQICCLLRDPKLTGELAKRGKEKVFSSFAMDIVAKNHEEYYQSLIN